MPINTPNMRIPNPIVGTDSGLVWEQSVNSGNLIVDAHNHTSGNGVPIPPAGLNINTALPFNGNQATGLGAALFTDQSSLATLNALYTIAGELWYNDPSGAVQITAGGLVNATSSGISSGTNIASFISNVLVVNTATNKPANIQGGSILLGNNTTGTHYLTLSPPAAMAGNITQTLPGIPGATGFMTMDSSGNMSASGIATANGIIRSNMAAVGQQVSSSSGNFQTASASQVDVTNLSVTITTTGRPVMLMLMCDGVMGHYATLGALNTGGSNAVGAIALFRGATQISLNEFAITAGTTAAEIFVPPGMMNFLDTPTSGTYTYKVQAAILTGTDLAVTNCVLVAYEL